MPSALDELAVANMALDHLQERVITALSNDTTHARWLDRNIDHTRDAFLMLNNWNFAVAYDELTEDATDPAFRYNRRYALPAGWLRLLPLREDGERSGTPIPYEIVDGYIHCDKTSTLRIRYIQQVADYTKWSSLALDAFALFLASRLAVRVSGKRSLKADLIQEYRDVVTLAVSLDAIQADDQVVEQHTILDVREG